MTSRVTPRFRELTAKLPANVRRQATTAYRRFRTDAQHPSLHFKKVHNRLPIYSARINDDFRALGQLRNDAIVRFWIGKHEEYERMLKQL